jgi:hypothetical protein
VQDGLALGVVEVLEETVCGFGGGDDSSIG